MATYDWNNDGKIDSRDDYLEYEELRSYEDNCTSSGRGMSTIGALICAISGLIEMSFVFTLLDVDIDSIKQMSQCSLSGEHKAKVIGYTYEIYRRKKGMLGV